MMRKTARRPIPSENHAHRNRPLPLAMEIIPTIPAASAAETCVISPAIGAACEMIEIPADVFRNNIPHRAYHCHFPRDSRNV